ncbi:MAG: pilus assembly protein [Actinobacteria bacterium]|nr:pilus assembly protein [Actinomycetota bacterium]
MGVQPVLSERGGVALELALTIPTLILVLLAVLEVVVVARIQLELVAAAREGARVAATNPDPAAGLTAATSTLSSELAGKVSVTVTRPAVVGRPATVTVRLPDGDRSLPDEHHG